MKQFYNVFSDEKVSALWTQLTWSHIRLLFSLDYECVNYYINVIVTQHISVRELESKIKSNEFERLSDDTKKKLMTKEKLEINDLIPNPILINNNYKYEILSEKILQKLILEDIPSFLKELGNGFTFVENEYRINLGDKYNYIDMLFFNVEYNCYVVVELKVTELKKEHIGQIQVYMNYINENLKKFNHEKTIGIIICKQDNKYVIKYCSDDRIIAREYVII